MKIGSARNWVRLFGVAAFGVALMMGWEFHIRAIVPLRHQETQVLRDVADLKGRIENAQKTIADIRIDEISAGNSAGEMGGRQPGVAQDLTAQSAPRLLKEHFPYFGIAQPDVRLTATNHEPDIPGYERTVWSVRVPIDGNDPNVGSLLRAAADLDPQRSHLRVLDFSLRPDPEDPERRLAAIHVSVLSRKSEAGR